jgi:hypothetical protein
MKNNKTIVPTHPPMNGMINLCGKESSHIGIKFL